MSKELMYGKNDEDYIVNISVKKDKVHIFKETPGGLRETQEDMSYFILKNEYTDGDYTLKGSQFFKYAKKYSNSVDWNSDKQYYKRDMTATMAINNKPEQFMTKNGHTYYGDMKPTDVSVLSFDLETTGLTHDAGSFVLLISNTFRDTKGRVTRKIFKYDDYDTNKEMIADWCKWVRGCNPSIMLGHNIFGFDLPYLKFCAEGPLKLGRDDSAAYFAKYESQYRKDGSQSYTYNNCTIFGRELVDTFFLSFKFAASNGRAYDSHSLKVIMKHEGLEKDGRIIWDWEKDPQSKIIDEKNEGRSGLWNKFIEYCQDDGDDALALFDLMIPAYFYLNQSIPMTLQQIINRASGAQVNSFMVRSYLQEGHSIARASDTIKFQGAISFGNPGVYSNVYKVDVASLYPSIIRQYEVFDKTKDPKGHFLKMTHILTEERLKNKALGAAGDVDAKMLEKAQKIFLNSGYGFLGAPGLNYNSPKNASLVTKYGRDIVEIAIEWATGEKYESKNK